MTKKLDEGYLDECIRRHRNGETWAEIAKGGQLTARQLRTAASHRNTRGAAGKLASSGLPPSVKFPSMGKSTEEHTPEGDIVFAKNMFFDKESVKTPDGILSAMGYDPADWSLTSWRITEWDAQTPDGEKTAYSVGGRIRPKAGLSDMRDVDFFNLAKDFFSKHDIGERSKAVPAKKAKTKPSDLLVEVPAIELHLGKRAHITDTPENYDIKDAERCFNEIFDDVIAHSTGCGTCLLVIGNDFFNAEFNNQTTNGTPQQNDGRYKKIFIKGMELYVNAIERLIPIFDRIDVRLCQGNHAQSAEFYLYHSLSQYFKDVRNVHFDENYRTTQSYVFGKVGIFFTHGDENEKRTIASIPAEFPKEWGETEFRELHLGHLHKEGSTIGEAGGMIVRRIPSPCAVDDWHYNKRFIGNQRCHQYFIWNREKGLDSIRYINV